MSSLFTKLRGHSLASAAAVALPVAASLLCSPDLFARVGGGGSFSGGHSGSGGGGGGVELIFFLFRALFWLTFTHPVIGIPIDIVVLVVIYRHFNRSSGGSDHTPLFQAASAPASPSPLAGSQPLAALRRFDPNFSEITLSDFCYSLYARAHHARGEGKLDQYSPYMSPESRAALIARNPANLTEVRDVIVGELHLDGIGGLETPLVQIPVTYQSNLTEVTAAGAQGWYLKEQWILERKRDTLSPTPQKAKADHCPRCGAPLSTRTDGACDYCGVKIVDGTFQWFVRSATVLSREERGPILTSDVPEEGTDFPTVYQADLAQQQAAFESAHAGFQWDAFQQSVYNNALLLQAAWTSRQWESVRPLETDSLFQMHRYWIDAYVKQGLHNSVDGYAVTRIEVVKIGSDMFYESVTVRLWAEGRDHTDDQAGKVVAGSSSKVRRWTEYWTFIRTRADARTGPSNCPNCGAPVTVGSTGICPNCGGKLTAGGFDWILSEIEQDETYEG